MRIHGDIIIYKVEDLENTFEIDAKELGCPEEGNEGSIFTCDVDFEGENVEITARAWSPSCVEVLAQGAVSDFKGHWVESEAFIEEEDEI